MTEEQRRTCVQVPPGYRVVIYRGDTVIEEAKPGEWVVAMSKLMDPPIPSLAVVSDELIKRATGA